MRSQEHLESHSLTYDKPLCASFDGFTPNAATRAGALNSAGREALLRFVLRAPTAQERLLQRPDGIVRITPDNGLTNADNERVWRRLYLAIASR